MKRIALLASTTIALAACSTEKLVAPDLTANLGTCANLQAPAGTQAFARTYATGMQIYRWDGNAWVLITPSAVLTVDAAYRTTVGHHYAGPTWEGIDGGKVTASVIDRCTPDANAIPWLSLGATSDGAPGVFKGTTFIQRVNTTGGKAPAAAGTVGEIRSIPYTAEYFFYRPE